MGELIAVWTYLRADLPHGKSARGEQRKLVVVGREDVVDQPAGRREGFSPTPSSRSQQTEAVASMRGHCARAVGAAGRYYRRGGRDKRLRTGPSTHAPPSTYSSL